MRGWKIDLLMALLLLLIFYVSHEWLFFAFSILWFVVSLVGSVFELVDSVYGLYCSLRKKKVVGVV